MYTRISSAFKWITGFLLLLLLPSVAFPQEHQESLSQPPSPTHTQPTVDSPLQNLPAIDDEYISVIQGVRHMLPMNRYFFENVDKIPGFSHSTANALRGSLHQVPALFHYSFQMLSSSAGGFGPPLPGTGREKPIRNQDKLDILFETTGLKTPHEDEWEKLPFPFRKKIVEILSALDKAKEVLDQFSEPVRAFPGKETVNAPSQVYDALIKPWKQRELFEFSGFEPIEQADLKKLSFATRMVAEELNWFIAQKDLGIPDDFRGCSIETALGLLVINTTKNDTIKGDPFFVIEPGGDDVYQGNTASPLSDEHPIGIVVDLSGDDQYLCQDHFLAAGILGIAVLLDLQGDDLYKTRKPGLAFSLYGSSMLYDGSGNDVYSGSHHCQAASYIGSSLFFDGGGDDKYHCGSYAQAFGGTQGVGIFYDCSGDDHYNTAPIDEMETIRSRSFIQGAAKGRWAEATDGQSLAGGIGVFIDNSGVDKYVAGSFSQGASYYFGLGLFNDNSGDDVYHAVSHSQGYAAHFSLAGFFDKKGDDTYNPASDPEKISQIIGGGRDFSAGLFMEYEGNDIYHFGNRSAGIGDMNGVGVLVDYAGDDEYIWHKNKVNSSSASLGKKIGFNEGMNIGFRVFQPPNPAHTGLFIDNSGMNQFKEQEQ